jgi:hypothetical protein
MRTMILFAAATFFIFGTMNTIMGVEPEKKEHHGCIFHMESMKDAKYEVTNTPDGVIIKITSDKPEVVKQIQECVTKCREAHKTGDHKGMCPMKKEGQSSGHKEEMEHHAK